MRHLARPVLISTRIRCKSCGWYYNPIDGFRGTCLACLDPLGAIEPEDDFAFHPPIPEARSPVEAKLEKRLNRAELALYYLHDTLTRLSSRHLPAPQETANALAVFDQNFPEYAAH